MTAPRFQPSIEGLPRQTVTDSDDATEALGVLLGAAARPGTIIALHGELGSGKTVLSRGIAHGIGVDEPVTSPTFPIVQTYETAAGRRLHHIDLYRLAGDDDALAFGIETYLEDPEAVVVIEWAQRLHRLLPEATTLAVHLRHLDACRREIRFA